MKRGLDFVGEIYRRNPVLALTGWLMLALSFVMLCIAPFDSRTITGINPWIKPLKFTISIAIFVWTLAWYLFYLPDRRWAVRLISWGIFVVFGVEMFCIILQAARGATSHFNVRTPFDAAIFSTMGLMITINTMLVLLALVLFFARTRPLPPAYLWGIRLGLLLFLLASVEGMTMIARMAHTVGQPDGGPGLPFVNWSTRAGDLRIAHFLGFHALQFLPLVGYSLSRSRRRALPERRQVAYLLIVALIYTAVGVLIFRQAMGGRPLISL
ncbi:MAG: hypothetical protein ICV68_02720 [Pyrinomonadaceae bacterium]|nr:hypothetical protein [Pyrinomonadaceae bacterium]